MVWPILAPVRAWVFNVGVDTLAAGLAGLVFFTLRPEGSVIALTAGQMLPAGAAGLTLLIANIALVDIMAIIREGWEFLNHWKYNYYLLETPQEAGFLTVGLIGGLLTAQAAWAPTLKRGCAAHPLLSARGQRRHAGIEMAAVDDLDHQAGDPKARRKPARTRHPVGRFLRGRPRVR